MRSKGERILTSIWDRWQHDEIYRTSQLSHNSSDAWVRYLDHVTQFDISHNAPQWQRERYANSTHLRSLDSNKQAGPFWKRQGYQEAKRELANLQKSKDKCSLHSSNRKRQHKKLDPWRAEIFAEPQNSGRQQPSSSSSWSPCPTWWSSSSWNQSWHKWLARVARRQMVRPMVKHYKVEFTLRIAAGNSLA